jgi:hypothetical protein
MLKNLLLIYLLALKGGPKFLGFFDTGFKIIYKDDIDNDLDYTVKNGF